MNLNWDYEQIKDQRITGRYLSPQHLEATLADYSPDIVRTSGLSAENRPVFEINLGSGPIRLLMWSQMHGNETTTTKAVLDLLRFLSLESLRATELLSSFSLKIFPMLNPDGAQRYTRENANGIDLNRDALELSQPESRILQKSYESFSPHYCFNLHDQRTIFGIGNLPATISFLAPAHDTERSISPQRAESMRLIVSMFKALESRLPGQIGRFDDTFNPQCTGDHFQGLGTPTVLIEAGHFPGDYQREKTREYVYLALFQAMCALRDGCLEQNETDTYFKIPPNEKKFVDLLLKNVANLNPKYKAGMQLGIQYKEVLRDGKIDFEPCLDETGELKQTIGHRTMDCSDPGLREILKEVGPIWELLN